MMLHVEILGKIEYKKKKSCNFIGIHMYDCVYNCVGKSHTKNNNFFKRSTQEI